MLVYFYAHLVSIGNGDVNVGDVLTNSDAAFGAFVRYTPHSRIGLKLGFIKGNLVGNRRGNSNNFDAYIVWGFQLSFNIFGKKSTEPQTSPYMINKWF